MSNFKGILTWLAIFVIGSLIVTFLVSPGSFNSFKSNIQNIVPSSGSNVVVHSAGAVSSNVESSEDPQTTECRQAFDECNFIVNQKYNLKYSLIKVEKFETIAGVAEFLRTWQTFSAGPAPTDVSWMLSAYCGKDCSDSIPLVLIAIKGTNLEGVTMSSVLFCDKSRELTSFTKSQVGC